jgi:hypothetical protein
MTVMMTVMTNVVTEDSGYSVDRGDGVTVMKGVTMMRMMTVAVVLVATGWLQC